MRAVRFDEYGSADVLEVRPVDDPVAVGDQVVVEVRAAGLNPGEIAIREGVLHERWPATFPSGQGSDLAGIVVAVGPDVRSVAVGDQVIGFSHGRNTHAERVAVPAAAVVPKPDGLGWPEAGSIYVAGTTALNAVGVLGLRADETVVVSAAAGGVGSIAAQLARRTGARVVGLASPRNHDWLRSHDVEPLDHAGDVEAAICAVAPTVDAFLDLFGGGYIGLALRLGVAPERIDTIIDFAGATEHGTHAVGGVEGTEAADMATVADLVARGEVELPIAATYGLDDVRRAYGELAERTTRGKRVLLPQT